MDAATPRDEARALKRPGAFTRFFLWCAAVDEERLATRAERFRYANLGALVLLVAVLGGATFTAFVSIVIGRFAWEALPVALGWALIIFSIDRMIVAEPHYREREALTDLASAKIGGDEEAPKIDPTALRLPGKREGSAVRAVVYGLRILVTAVLAFLISEALLLMVYQPEVRAQLVELHREEFSRYVAAHADEQEISQQERRDKLKDAQTDLKNARARVEEDLRKMANEKDGVSGDGYTGLGGYGRQYENLEKQRDEDEKAVKKAEKKVDQLTQEIKDNDDTIAKLRAGDEKTIEAEGLDEARDRIYDNDGFHEQQKAFNRFLDQAGGDPLLVAAPWALRILLISIDLLPLTQKLLNRYTIYGRRLSEEALILRYQDVGRGQRALHDVEEIARLEALYSAHNQEVERKRADWRRSWRMNHMRHPD